MLLWYNEKSKKENKMKKVSEKKYSFKYTIIVIVMFLIGILLGVFFSNTSNSGDKKISRDRAKEIALEDAKKDFSKEVSLDTDISVKIDKDIYEVSFFLGGIEYEYEIRMSDGVILDKDRDIPTNDNSSDTPVITLEEAKEKVLKEVNLKEKEVTFLKEKKEKYGSTYIYELEFYTNDKKFEYDVNPNTGNTLRRKEELRNKYISNSSNEITIDEAKAIALKDANLSSNDVSFSEKFVISREENHNYYELEFFANNKEYEYEIELSTGIILESSWKLR